MEGFSSSLTRFFKPVITAKDLGYQTVSCESVTYAALPSDSDRLTCTHVGREPETAMEMVHRVVPNCCSDIRPVLTWLTTQGFAHEVWKRQSCWPCSGLLCIALLESGEASDRASE